jgi:hypothetical protein
MLWINGKKQIADRTLVKKYSMAGNSKSILNALFFNFKFQILAGNCYIDYLITLGEGLAIRHSFIHGSIPKDTYDYRQKISESYSRNQSHRCSYGITTTVFEGLLLRVVVL